jgi:hypothetical protein
MTDLSPAAQSVLDAAMQCEINPECYSREAVAVLRAIAVAHTQQHRGLGVLECDADELLAIADELESASQSY